MVGASVTSSEKRVGCYTPTHQTGPQKKKVHLIPSKQIKENPQNHPEVSISRSSTVILSCVMSDGHIYGDI
jgi:hypothetical protein